MPVSWFGNDATRAFAARLPAEMSIVVADPTGFAGAVGELITRGLAGAPRDLFILPANPRAQLLQLAVQALQERAQSHDALLGGLDGVAAAKIGVNGRTQEQVEQDFLVAGADVTFQDLTLLADRTFFRSFHELERTVLHYGYRPVRPYVFTPPEHGVPLPETGVSSDGSICVWAAGVHPAIVAAFEAACFDIRRQITVAGVSSRFKSVAPQDAAVYLSRAATIVCLSDDPGTIYALARYRKPLCAPVCGAAEIVAHLSEFQPWNRIQLVDAVLRSFEGQPVEALPHAERFTTPKPAARLPEDGPLVSIVMPTYSRPATLCEGLQRLQNQTYKNIEIIVVNNAGTPVDDVVAQFPNALLINRAENTGNATRPRIDGIDAAKGKYITLLDDDDVYFPEHIARMVATLERTGAAAAYSDFLVRFVDRDAENKETIWGFSLEKPFGITSFELLVTNRLGYFTVFMRRDLIDRIGPFAEEVLGGEEVEYWLRIARHTDFVHIAQPSSAYTVVRSWRGQLSEKSHALYAGGYEMVYERYPAENLPLVQQARRTYVASLRSTDVPPAMQPRYRIGPA